MFQIDQSKRFPHLPRAPIVEAVLHWQAAASTQLDKEALEVQLQKSFPDYEIAPQHNIEMALSESSDGMEMRHSKAWEGFRLIKKQDGQPAFVCQFKRDGIIFSRLAPYQGWLEFEKESLQFWQKFVEICKPPELAKLSTRYISQIPIDSVSEVENFIEYPPGPLTEIGASTEGFLYQENAKLEDLPYTVTLVRAVQPTQQATPLEKSLPEKSLFVDISVSTTDSITDFGLLPQKLLDFRFIKNELFFRLMKNTEANFGEP